MNEIKKIPFSCSYDCGSRCELVAHVKNDEIIRIDTPTNRPDSITQPRLIPCVKGRSRKRSTKALERVKTPLKRTGPRGSGKFEEVTWDNALIEVALQLEKIKDEYGFEAVFHANGSGSILPSRRLLYVSVRPVHEGGNSAGEKDRIERPQGSYQD